MTEKKFDTHKTWKLVTINMPEHLIERLNKAASSQYMNRTQYVIEIVRQACEKAEEKEKERQRENLNSLITGGDVHRTSSSFNDTDIDSELRSAETDLEGKAS